MRACACAVHAASLPCTLLGLWLACLASCLAYVCAPLSKLVWCTHVERERAAIQSVYCLLCAVVCCRVLFMVLQPNNFALLAVASGLMGAFCFAVLPVALELGVEMTFGVSCQNTAPYPPPIFLNKLGLPTLDLN